MQYRCAKRAWWPLSARGLPTACTEAYYTPPAPLRYISPELLRVPPQHNYTPEAFLTDRGLADVLDMHKECPRTPTIVFLLHLETSIISLTAGHDHRETAAPLQGMAMAKTSASLARHGQEEHPLCQLSL
jgi:hypothetical protein